MPGDSGHTGERSRADARREARIAARTQREASRIAQSPVSLAAGTTTGSVATGTVATPARSDESTRQGQPRIGVDGRLGFRAAFRASVAAAPIRSDLRALPGLLRSRAFAVPLIVAGATTVVAIQPGALASTPVQLAVQSILLPPAFVLAFLAGMLTRRGSWMMGGLFGVISYVGSIVVAHVGDLGALDASNPIRALLEGAGGLGAGDALLGNLYFVAIAGVLAGAFAGWYGRFLRAMSPAAANSRDRRRRDAEQRKGRSR